MVESQATRKMQPYNVPANRHSPIQVKLRIVESNRIVPRCIGATPKGPLGPDLVAFLLVGLAFPRPCNPIADGKRKNLEYIVTLPLSWLIHVTIQVMYDPHAYYVYPQCFCKRRFYNS